MADPPPTRLHIDPPIVQWQVTPRNGRTKPLIATGHQPTFWHPGILAKDLAADAFAKHVGGTTLHVVVEHNPLGPLAIDLPTQQGMKLRTQSIRLGPTTESAILPPNRLSPIDAVSVDRAIRGAGGVAVQTATNGLNQIAKAYAEQGEHPHLSAQTTAVLSQLKRPYLHADMPTRPTSELVTQHFIERLLSDPVGCVRAYNRAANAYPEAGIRPLYIGRDVVEVPLWAQGPTSCTPVFIDLGDSKRPYLFTTQHNQQLDLSAPNALKHLRPRAITLSALMRSEHCDLFIHGSGGGVYDQVTERWWHDWAGEALAPMAVVSADVYLPFDVPTATRDDLTRAVWFDHHLPFNVERYTDAGKGDAEAALVSEKRNLLDHMNDDRDKRRRAKAFKRIHAINAELRDQHADRLAQARRAAEDARVGVSNAAIARRRGWCFALYPGQSLRNLRQSLADFATMTH